MKILKIFSQPFPLKTGSDYLWKNLLSAFLYGMFVWLFLEFFQPFGIANWVHPNKHLYLFYFGLITTVCLLFLWFILFRVFPGFFKEEKWTVGKEIFLNLLILLLIALSNYYYGTLIFIGNLSIHHFFWSFISVVAIGIFPIGFGVLTKYQYLNARYNKQIPQVNHPEVADSTIELLAENGKDKLTLKQTQLFYIESADNYSSVYSLQNNKPVIDLIRGSLTRLEEQIKSPEIVRCHRSYIVNLNQVDSLTGNAQGYKLHFKEISAVVPLARKYAFLIENLK